MPRNKIKVLHLGKFFSPRKGGIETATENIINSTSSDIEHCLICFENNNTILEPNIKRCRYVSIFNQPLSLRYCLEYYRQYLKADIVYLHSPNYLALLLIFFFRPKKILIHWHASIDFLTKRWFLFPLNYIEKTILKYSEAIIVGTLEYAKHSHNLKKHLTDKVRIIPYGIKSILIDSIQKENVIILVGRMVEYKGFTHFLKKVNIPKGWKVIFIGNGPEISKLEDIRLSRNLQESVIFKTSCDDDELHRYLNKSKIFILPSITRQESFGIVQLEAMSAKNVVLNFRVKGSGIWQIFGGNLNHFSFNPGDYRSMNDMIIKLVNDDTLMKKSSYEFHENFKKNYTIEKYQSEIEKLIKYSV